MPMFYPRSFPLTAGAKPHRKEGRKNNRGRPGIATDRLTLKKMRDNADEKTEGHSACRSRLRHKSKIETQINNRRPTAMLQGYFTPQAETYCKTFSPEELAKLNEERKEELVAGEPSITELCHAATHLFTFEERQEMSIEGLKNDTWLDSHLKPIPVKEMNYNHIISVINCLEGPTSKAIMDEDVAEAWVARLTEEKDSRQQRKKTNEQTK